MLVDYLEIITDSLINKEKTKIKCLPARHSIAVGGKTLRKWFDVFNWIRLYNFDIVSLTIIFRNQKKQYFRENPKNSNLLDMKHVDFELFW